ncbi:MAG: outer membrane protein assembly factor BamA [Geminicoccaceae bacterium]
MRRVVLALLVLTGALFPVPASKAQSDAVVEAIRVEGNQRIEPSTVETYLTLDIGDPFDPVEIDRSLQQLFATGLFDDVRVDQEGTTLVVRVVENPIINQIAFEGNRRVGDEILESEVQLRSRVVYTRSKVQSAVQRILEIYRRNGLYAATVEPKAIQLAQNRVNLVFEVVEGPKTVVDSIVFIGNEAFNDNTLRSVIETKESRIWRVLPSADTYDPDRLSFDEELLRRFYTARGYAEFEVLSSLAELTPEGDKFFITFTLSEGPVYRFGEISVDSRLRDLQPEQVQQDLRTEQGDTYNAELIEETIDEINDRLGTLGYAFIDVEPQLTPGAEPEVLNLTYVINEGLRVFVERINISGNVRTLDEVIRREFQLAEGDAFNANLLAESERRIRNLGFFENVDVRRRRGSTADRIIIDVTVTEQSTGELSFGAGFSTTDGPLGDVRLRERNLIGTGQELRANFTISGRRQEIDLGFTEPYFLDRDLAAGIDLFRRTTDFQDEGSFDETNTGGTLRASYPLTRGARHAVRYTFSFDEIEDVDDDASVFIQAEEGEIATSAVGQTFTLDRRDVRFFPSDGYLLRLDQELAGLGGDSQYLRHEGTASYFYPFTSDVVLNLGARAGHIFGIDDDIRLSDRFFIGGSNLRGFSFAGLGPRDTATDDALGGNTFVIGTAELRFPLGLPDELRLFGRGFAEGGTLTGIDVSGPTLVDTSNLRLSVGVGLSWLSPLGPISIDVAEAVAKDADDETESLRVSFGTRF